MTEKVEWKWMKWEECSMEDALEFSQGKKIFRDGGINMSLPSGSFGGCDVVSFVDGTAVACESRWSGPYSEVTPDIDAQPPKWWSGVPQ